MAPEIKKIVLPTPQLDLNWISQIVPLVIEMDRAVAIVNSLAPAQINYTKIVWKCVRVFLEPQAKSQNVVEALLEPASGAEGFLVFSENGVLAFEVGTNQIFLD